MPPRSALLLPAALASIALAQGVPAPVPAGTAAVAPPIMPTFHRPEPRLAPGSQVRTPQLGPFVKGTPVTAFEQGKVYVFEFFSTTCSHCEEHFDLICEIVRNFTPRGVEFISVTGETEDKVKAWLAKPGKDRVAWSVACDPGEVTTRAWQDGTLRNFTPRFFVVKDGQLQWIGHPNLSEGPLQRIVDGTFDVQAARQDFTLDTAVTVANATIDGVMRSCQKSGDWQPLFDMIESVAEQIPERAGTFQAERFMAMIGQANRVDRGYEFGRSLLKAWAKDPRTLRALARGVLTGAAVRRRDVDFALEAATAADAAAGGNDPKALETLGLAWFAKGDRDKAVDCVERAMKIETERKFRKQYERTLAKFRKDTPGPLPPFVDRSPAAKAKAGTEPAASGSGEPAPERD